MIGGRVLDGSALVAFAAQTSLYAAALVWTAVAEGIVLADPTTAVAAAVAGLAEKDRAVLDVLMALPVTVDDDLTVARAYVVGELGGDPLDAHAAACARDRGWPVVTADAARYAARAGTVEVEQLP